MLFERIGASNNSMGEHDKVGACIALYSLLDGVFPSPDRICLLKEVLTEPIVQELLSARENKNLAARAKCYEFSEAEKNLQQG
jgi:hypothetical protein